MSAINNIKTSLSPMVGAARHLHNHNATKLDMVTTISAQVDTLSLTNTAINLQALQQKIADSSAVNQERVDAIRSAIDDGSYQVDVTVLAQNIINAEQQR